MKISVDEPGTLRINLDGGSDGFYTIRNWLSDCVNFSVPDSAVNSILAQRDVEGDLTLTELKESGIDKRLLKADLLKWIVLGVGKVNNTSDSDNGWSHSDGGYTLSEYDKKLLKDEANEIYAELEPDSVFGKKKIRMRSAGIMPAYLDSEGDPLPRRPI